MNPLLSRLQPYPFERLRQLHADITPNPAYTPISLGLGEPRHATPQLIKDALSASLAGLASYPAPAGGFFSGGAAGAGPGRGGREGGAPHPFLSNLRGRGAAGGRASLVCP